MPDYRIEKPEPRPVKHIVKFTRDEVIEALTRHAAYNKIILPDGQIGLWGLDEHDTHMREQVITLTVEEEVVKEVVEE